MPGHRVESPRAGSETAQPPTRRRRVRPARSARSPATRQPPRRAACAAPVIAPRQVAQRKGADAPPPASATVRRAIRERRPTDSRGKVARGPITARRQSSPDAARTIEPRGRGRTERVTGLADRASGTRVRQSHAVPSASARPIAAMGRHLHRPRSSCSSGSRHRGRTIPELQAFDERHADGRATSGTARPNRLDVDGPHAGLQRRDIERGSRGNSRRVCGARAGRRDQPGEAMHRTRANAGPASYVCIARWCHNAPEPHRHPTHRPSRARANSVIRRRQQHQQGSVGVATPPCQPHQRAECRSCSGVTPATPAQQVITDQPRDWLQRRGLQQPCRPVTGRRQRA